MARSTKRRRGGGFNHFNNTLSSLPASTYYPQNSYTADVSAPSSILFENKGGKRRGKRGGKSSKRRGKSRSKRGGFGAMDALSTLIPFSSFSNTQSSVPFTHLPPNAHNHYSRNIIA